MAMEKSYFFAIYADERLTLHGSMAVEKLIVHLGNPGATIEIGDHGFTYDKIGLYGKGQFTITRHGETYRRYQQ